MKEIKKYLESRIGKYSFFFEDLKSGYVYGYNENVSMTAAGCMKLPIAVSLIKAVEEKKLDFMDKIKIQSKDKVYGTGITSAEPAIPDSNAIHPAFLPITSQIIIL